MALITFFYRNSNDAHCARQPQHTAPEGGINPCRDMAACNIYITLGIWEILK
jgi:hypothetical protein